MSLEISSCTNNGRQSITVGNPAKVNGKLLIADSLAGANPVQWWFSSSLQSGSGSNGLRMNRRSADNTPLAFGWYQDNLPQWESGLDGTTNDLILAYSHGTASDNIRLRRDTAQMQIGRTVGSPTTSAQVEILGGDGGFNLDSLYCATFGDASANLTLTRNDASPAHKRVKLVFYGQGSDGWQMATDTAANGTCDLGIFSNATSNYPLVIARDDSVTLGTTTALSALLVKSPKLGFYNHATVAQQLLATGAGHTVDDVITALQALGLVRQS